MAQGGIHRFRHTGANSKLLTGARVTTDGIRLAFNFELDEIDADKFTAQQWNYRWQASYGSKFYSVERPGETGKDDAAITGVSVAGDRRSVLLKIPNIRPVNQLKLNLEVPGKDGGLFSEEIYFTINRVPGKSLPDTKEITRSLPKQAKPRKPKRRNSA